MTVLFINPYIVHTSFIVPLGDPKPKKRRPEEHIFRRSGESRSQKRMSLTRLESSYGRHNNTGIDSLFPICTQVKCGVECACVWVCALRIGTLEMRSKVAKDRHNPPIHMTGDVACMEIGEPRRISFSEAIKSELANDRS